MLERVRLGPITQNPMDSCIAGEAPPLESALKKFPQHYPMIGRMQNVTGTFEWRGKRLTFCTETQAYSVDEYHILYRLKQLGIKPKSEPRKATLNAVWAVNKIHGLQFFYMQGVKLQED